MTFSVFEMRLGSPALASALVLLLSACSGERYIDVRPTPNAPAESGAPAASKVQTAEEAEKQVTVALQRLMQIEQTVSAVSIATTNQSTVTSTQVDRSSAPSVSIELQKLISEALVSLMVSESNQEGPCKVIESDEAISVSKVGEKDCPLEMSLLRSEQAEGVSKKSVLKRLARIKDQKLAEAIGLAIFQSQAVNQTNDQNQLLSRSVKTQAEVTVGSLKVDAVVAVGDLSQPRSAVSNVSISIKGREQGAKEEIASLTVTADNGVSVNGVKLNAEQSGRVIDLMTKSGLQDFVFEQRSSAQGTR